MISSKIYVGEGYFKVTESGNDVLLECKITIEKSDGHCLVNGYLKHYSENFWAKKTVFHAEVLDTVALEVKKARITLCDTPLIGSLYTKDFLFSNEGISCGLFVGENAKNMLSISLRELSSGIEITGIWERSKTIYFNLNLKEPVPLNVKSNVVSIGELA